MDLSVATRAPRRQVDAKLRLRRVLRRVGFAFSIAVMISPAILVFLWMVSLSLKNEIDNIAYPPVFVPHPPTLANFIQVLQQVVRILINAVRACALEFILTVPSRKNADPQCPCTFRR